MCQSGAQAISIDDVDMTRIKELVPRRVVIIGNISPLKFFKNSPEEMEKETIKLLEIIKRRKEFLVAPGCDLAPQTPLENIQAFVKTAKNYRH